MRKWFRRFGTSGFFIPFILLLPYVCTIVLNGADKALLLHSPEVEELVPLVLVAQLKGDYEDEAVKAQAVIARSEVYRRLEAGENEGEICGKIGFGKLLGMADKLQQYSVAAEATAGQVLTYNGELKLVPYHEVSNGKTRDGEEVFHSGEYAYLKSVDSSQDKESPDYVNSTYVAASQFPAKLVIKKRDSAGYITALTADESWIEGETFRQGMHLASADFSVQKMGKMVRFLCKGKGHGLGFSQYGGNEMAKEGCRWEEILEAYFPEMEVTEVESLK
ncbi:SpoIID/LytB domain protein [Blautia glucerasea]|uniref:SpoIID/LytB domain-containing protein n=1 Tax=Blautia glucerasea TaxID=536633 RepID=UPI001D003548|nr:SpoIID/LytB domain-containing protein [Blautia glucerasea]MCB5388702.1 SpoIID/LytB domain protein [Blautia glucerasea]MCB5423232.1 SpoIID/LytB domain protein [Blautia luti]